MDFPHFIEIYFAISGCLLSPDDIELITREFLAGQAAQNIRHSEVTYTPYTHFNHKGLAFEDQLAAINRGRAWAEQEFGVTMGLVPGHFPQRHAGRGPAHRRLGDRPHG